MSQPGENKRKAKSAPSRFSAREDVWKGIRDWAKPSDRTNQLIGSQVKDNVTEQRMLESRLLDLSKERYKFIVQGAWERKVFIDKQKAKTGQMKDLLAGIEAAQIKTNRQSQANQLNSRNKDYCTLRLHSYADRMKRGNSARNFLQQMKPICIEPVFKTQQEPTFSSRASTTKYGLGTHQTVFPNIVNASKQPIHATGHPVARLETRQSVPANMGSVLKKTNNNRSCFSAGNLPRYLKYRSVYDSRFSELEKTLCLPQTADEISLNKLLSGLPSPVPSNPPSDPT